MRVGCILKVCVIVTGIFLALLLLFAGRLYWGLRHNPEWLAENDPKHRCYEKADPVRVMVGDILFEIPAKYEPHLSVAYPASSVRENSQTTPNEAPIFDRNTGKQVNYGYCKLENNAPYIVQDWAKNPHTRSWWEDEKENEREAIKFPIFSKVQILSAGENDISSYCFYYKKYKNTKIQNIVTYYECSDNSKICVFNIFFNKEVSFTLKFYAENKNNFFSKDAITDKSDFYQLLLEAEKFFQSVMPNETLKKFDYNCPYIKETDSWHLN